MYFLLFNVYELSLSSCFFLQTGSKALNFDQFQFVFVSDGLQEEDIYMNTESACTVDEMPRDTTEGEGDTLI